LGTKTTTDAKFRGRFVVFMMFKSIILMIVMFLFS